MTSSSPNAREEGLFFNLLMEERFMEIERSLFKNDDSFLNFNTILVVSAMKRNWEEKPSKDPSTWAISQSIWKTFLMGMLIRNPRTAFNTDWSFLAMVLSTNHLGALEALGALNIFTAKNLSQPLSLSLAPGQPTWTPLSLVASLHSDPHLLPLLKYLTALGADINVPDKQGLTPLAATIFYCLPNNKLEAINWMLTKAQANPNQKLFNEESNNIGTMM